MPLSHAVGNLGCQLIYDILNSYSSDGLPFQWGYIRSVLCHRVHVSMFRVAYCPHITKGVDAACAYVSISSPLLILIHDQVVTLCGKKHVRLLTGCSKEELCTRIFHSQRNSAHMNVGAYSTSYFIIPAILSTLLKDDMIQDPECLRTEIYETDTLVNC